MFDASVLGNQTRRRDVDFWGWRRKSRSFFGIRGPFRGLRSGFFFDCFPRKFSFPLLTFPYLDCSKLCRKKTRLRSSHKQRNCALMRKESREVLPRGLRLASWARFLQNFSTISSNSSPRRSLFFVLISPFFKFISTLLFLRRTISIDLFTYASSLGIFSIHLNCSCESKIFTFRCVFTSIVQYQAWYIYTFCFIIILLVNTY